MLRGDVYRCGSGRESLKIGFVSGKKEADHQSGGRYMPSEAEQQPVRVMSPPDLFAPY